MAVLSRRSFGTIDLLRVDSNPDGSVTAPIGSLAIISSTRLVYKSAGGTSWSQVLSNTGSGGGAGSQGAQGAQGSPGFTGARGIQGSIGVQGNIGARGAQGDAGGGGPGAQGSQGSLGVQGQSGLIGAQGQQGAQGNDGSFSPPEAMNGDPGSQGSQGHTGNPGIPGSQGSVGSQGLQGAQGHGTQGQQGQPGSPGALGVQGAQSVGNQGYQGNPGAQGSQGNAGPQGLVGSAGVSSIGSQGAQGNQGASGAAGSQGAQGTAGGSAGSSLVLISSNIVAGSAATTITFSGLNGNTDKIYLLRARIKRPQASQLTNYPYYFRPNGSIPATVSLTYFTAGYGSYTLGGGLNGIYAGSASGNGAGVNGAFYNGMDNLDDEFIAETWIYAESTRARSFLTTRFNHHRTNASGINGAGYSVTNGMTHVRWNDTSTNLISLDIHCGISGGFDVGSELHLYKLIT